MEPSTLDLIYDGECPFCSRYVNMIRLKENTGQVRLHNAREGGYLSEFPKANHYDLNEGMLAIWNGEYYFGGEAIALISTLSSRAPLGFILKNKTTARLSYPLLRFFRNIALLVKGTPQL